MEGDMQKLLGIDVGSTTVKFCLTDGKEILYTSYVRHFSRVKECVLGELEKIRPLASSCRVAITGSAGLGIAQRGKLPFVQEVQAAYTAIRKHAERKKIDAETRAAALELAREYRDRALMDREYFLNGYAGDMELEHIYAEVKKRLG